MGSPSRRLIVICGVLGCGFLVGCQTPRTPQPVTPVADGKSPAHIVISLAAPPSVAEAAKELQHYVKRATGRELPIITDENHPTVPWISLGDTAVARAAGLAATGIKDGGFRIVTQDGNLYILGPDTPAGGLTAEGGTSEGTRNGVYAFLEEVLDIRWLMPGELGEDVPVRATFTIPVMDRTEAPFFVQRSVPYTGRFPEVEPWNKRQRLGRSLRIHVGHNWQETVPAALYQEHPEWFPELGGKRIPPSRRYKLETTNPGLIQFYADQAMKAFQDPTLKAFSLSPSDSAGWSESRESKLLYDTDPHGNVSHTKLVLKFYNDVARIVGRKYPDRLLCGLVYSTFLYPPSDGMPALEPNLFLELAPSIAYGYQLYRPTVQQDVDMLLRKWSKAMRTGTQAKLVYYDLPIHLLNQTVGAPTPPGREILKFIYPRLARSGVMGVDVYGKDTWGTDALSNYLLARLSWNPLADVDALAEEWYHRAYGREAGRKMAELDALLEAALKEHYLHDLQASYTLTMPILEGVYAKHWPDIETLFLAARQLATDPKPQARLALYEQNLVLLRYHLVTDKLIEDRADSPLRRTGRQIEEMLVNGKGKLGLPPKAIIEDEPFKVERVSVRAEHALHPAARPAGLPELAGKTTFLFYPTADEEIAVRCLSLENPSQNLRYRVYGALGQKLDSGFLAQQSRLAFAASERQVCFLEIIPSGSGIYQLVIEGSPYALRADAGGFKFLQRASSNDFYVYVPEKIAAFSLQFHTARAGAAGAVYSPTGKVVTSFNLLPRAEPPVQEVVVNTETEPAGFWKISIRQRDGVPYEGVQVSLRGELAPWVIVDPQQPIVIGGP